MVEFKSIHIKNFMSIEDVHLTFDTGVFNIIGENGVGKTSILMALEQGLYNKCSKVLSENIDATYNKVTNKPYTIIIEFEKDGLDYTVINDRSTNSITILKEDEDITAKGIRNQLTQIQNIIGLDYNSFSAFYYLSVSTLTNIFDVTNEQNLIFKFFDIDTLKFIESKTKALVRETKKEVSLYLANISSVNNQISKLKSYEEVDTNKLTMKKMELQESLLLLDKSDTKLYLDNELNKYNNISTVTEKQKVIVQQKKTEYSFVNNQYKELEKGICPTCKQSTKGITNTLENQVVELLEQYKQEKFKLEELQSKQKEIKETLSNLQKTFNERKAKLEKEINYIDTQLLIYESRDNTSVQALQNHIKDLEIEKEKFTAILKEKNNILAVLSVVNNILKSKVILKKYLNSFIILLNNYTQELVELVNLSIGINIVEKSGKLDFSFTHNDIEVSINSLSSGEKTRVSLVVLFAMLNTLQKVSKVKFNIIALDEVLGVLDKDGVEVLKTILDFYRKDLSIYLIQHHSEIEDKFFDGTLRINKLNGITQVERKMNE